MCLDASVSCIMDDRCVNNLEITSESKHTFGFDKNLKEMKKAVSSLETLIQCIACD